MLAEHSNKLSQKTSRNSRTNLSHTLDWGAEASAMQTSTRHYGILSTNIKTNYVNEVV